MTDKTQLLPVTQEATIEFLNHAFRNIDLPELFPADLADIAGGLERIIRAALTPPTTGQSPTPISEEEV